MNKANLFPLLLAFMFSYSAHAEQCATRLSDVSRIIGVAEFPTSWKESSETSDNKPLYIQFSRTPNDEIKTTFTKSVDNKVWMLGETAICTEGDNLVLKMKDITVTGDAPFPLRWGVNKVGENVVIKKTSGLKTIKISLKGMSLEFKPALQMIDIKKQ